jgi:hypothetical protein
LTRTSRQATVARGCQREALGEEEKDKTVVKEGMLDLTDDRTSCFQWMYELLMVEHSVVWSMRSEFGWGFVRGLMDDKVAQLARCRSGWWDKLSETGFHMGLGHWALSPQLSWRPLAGEFELCAAPTLLTSSL